MKKVHLIIVAVCIVAFSLWFFNNKSENESINTKVGQVKTAKAGSQSVQKKPAAIGTHKSASNIHKKNVMQDEALSNAAQQVAILYESALKYPAYSQPLTALDEDRLQPNKFYPVASPIDDSGNSLSLNLKKYRYIYPDSIVVNVSAQGLGTTTIELSNPDTKEILNTQQSNGYKGELVVTFKGREDYPRNLQLFVEADIAGKKVPVVAQIQYMAPSATLTGFSHAFARSENMVIPAHLTVIKRGLYRVRANLYNGDTPIAHLVTKERLSEGNQTIDLKAHWSVLPTQITTMRLSNFVIERMSPSPGELNSFGDSDISSFAITDFAFDSLQQLPYQANAQEKQSLEFLQGLANKE